MFFFFFHFLFFFFFFFFFFFQAEDGIRDDLVTGVQTCALPICRVPQDPAGVHLRPAGNHRRGVVLGHPVRRGVSGVGDPAAPGRVQGSREIGRASCRERVEIAVGDGLLKKKKVGKGESGSTRRE